jgi:methylmalonyl-CoA mutase
VACFAAGAGGADAVTVQPFDACLGLPDPFARRIARNTQSVLLEEAHVGRVLDPAGGSGYVRARTEQLAQAAWELFTEMERAGGMAAALASGMVAQRLAQTWERRAANLAHRVDPVTGVSAYPNLAETLPRRAPAPAQPSGGLPRHHYAEQFEALRERAEAYAAKHGAPPTAFLATLGPAAAHTERASFAANLFAAGGIATVSAGPVTGPAEMAALHAASGADLVCLCGTDKAYAELAGPMAAALAGGARAVWLAGKPAGYPGVERYLYSGVDAVAVLHGALDLLEAA